jgi:hypothetical protein
MLCQQGSTTTQACASEHTHVIHMIRIHVIITHVISTYMTSTLAALCFVYCHALNLLWADRTSFATR